MKVLITGADGYTGRYLSKVLEDKNLFDEVIEIDSGYRRDWVEEVGGTPLHEPPWRSSCVAMDITSDHFSDFLWDVKPDVIVHLAAQPSAPYSESTLDRANFTLTNNLMSTLRILWYIRKMSEKPRLIYTSTTGIYGIGAKGNVIPEGFYEDGVMHPNLAGSVYHLSKGFDVENCYLFYRKGWLDDFIDLRTSIVFGFDPETRFDIDPYFGTFYNRMVYFALTDKPLTIYGSGKQFKPFISLEDFAESVIKAILLEGKDFRVYNQLTYQARIIDVANRIVEFVSKFTDKEPKIVHIKNPRIEPETDFYRFDNRKFFELLGEPKPIEKHIKEDIKKIVNSLGV